jgi:hypothetical protein
MSYMDGDSDKKTNMEMEMETEWKLWTYLILLKLISNHFKLTS